MNNARKKSSAFTLFELILVMFLIALTIALAAPSLAGFARTRLVADTATHFTALASFARNRATADGQTYRLNIDLPNRQFSLTHDDGTGQNFIAVNYPDAQPFTLPKDLQVETDAPEINGLRVIEFHPEGRTDVGTLRFSDIYGNGTTVSCTSPFSYYHITSGPDAPEVTR